EGDLLDPLSLSRAIFGSSLVFHVAADYRLSAPDREGLMRTTVEGTRNVLAAAAEAGVSRVVYTSSVGALGLDADGRAADETTPVSRTDMIGAYKRSKFDAERVAFDFVAKGLDVVVVNPSTPVGERDVKPTPTGKMIVDFLNRRLPAYVDTGLNLVDVKDVAAGHVLAAERGRVGEKYILGNRNMTLKEIWDTLSRLTSIPAPPVRLPHWLPLTAALVDSAVARLTGRSPKIPLEGVRMSRQKMFFDASKAVRELGLPQTPVEEPLSRAAQWFREKGYVHA